MCGIVAYIGSKDAYQIVVKGLKRLEYRGYDSAGISPVPPARPRTALSKVPALACPGLRGIR